MKVLLLQLDGRLPNLALMAIAQHHRERGDDVELRQCRRPDSVQRGLFDCAAGKIYASLIFEKSKPIANELLRLYPEAVVGGTGWDCTTTLEHNGIDSTRYDYSDYAFRQSIGFTQRGCRLECGFCVVPKKEGKVKESSTIHDIWRGEPWPREVLLLDNDFFGQPNWRSRIKELNDGEFKVSFNQGINCRMLSDEAAEAIASVNYRDDSMKVKRIYTAWDNRKDEDTLFRGLNRLVKCGVKPDHIMVYMLIGYWADEKEDDWIFRQRRLREFGCRPYPMPFVRTPLTVGFQRWCIGAYDKRIPWDEWRRAKCEPRNLGRQERQPLRLFEDV